MTVHIEYLSEFRGERNGWVGLRSLETGEFAPLRTVGPDGRERMGGIDAEAERAVVWLAAANPANGVVSERETVAEVAAGESQVFTFRGPRRPEVERRLRIRVLVGKDV